MLFNIDKISLNIENLLDSLRVDVSTGFDGSLKSLFLIELGIWLRRGVGKARLVYINLKDSMICWVVIFSVNYFLWAWTIFYCDLDCRYNYLIQLISY